MNHPHRLVCVRSWFDRFIRRSELPIILLTSTTIQYLDPDCQTLGAHHFLTLQMLCLFARRQSYPTLNCCVVILSMHSDSDRTGTCSGCISAAWRHAQRVHWNVCHWKCSELDFPQCADFTPRLRWAVLKASEDFLNIKHAKGCILKTIFCRSS